ncbi:MAG: NAD(P)/FAD-dependent oxidoreductase [Candidatus Bathyarchaeota archaeon]|nr:NAD(P)/FAD-dependent oxidoreductase [Candidatus Bathyarchaeota archaeon]
MSPLQYDIVVVGAGPSGSMAAKIAAQHGAKVALLEEHATPGTPVNCAEALSINAIKLTGLKPEPPIMAQKINTIRLYAPDRSTIDLTGPELNGCNLNRDVFDRLLAENAEKAGADLHVKTKSLGVIKENGAVVGVKAIKDGESVEFRAKIVIGADGHSSITRRTAGLGRYFNDIGVCAQYTVIDLELEDPTVNEIYIGSTYTPGAYVWVFPKSSTEANVGLGIRNVKDKSAIQQLDEFIAKEPRFKDKPKTRKTGGICPATGPLENVVDNGLMLIGDAAGQLLPLTGAGVHTSIQSGMIAGEVAARAVQENNVSATRLAEYSDRFDNAWGKGLRDSRKMLDLLDKLSDDDFNKLAKLITQPEILKLINGKSVFMTALGIALKDPLYSLKILTKLF